jgi:hypothetical protein
MSESRFVYGIAPPDDRWKQMKQIWDACQTAGIDAPDEVHDFFGEEGPDEAGVVLELTSREWVDQDPNSCRNGEEIDLKDIPKHVQTIRFVVSY